MGEIYPVKPVATSMTPEDRKYQHEVLDKYRNSTKEIPTIQETAREANVSTSTVIGFFSGNSSHINMRVYLRKLFAEKFAGAMPEDLAKLLAIWDRDKK